MSSAAGTTDLRHVEGALWRPRGLVVRLIRGRTADPVWVRPALLGLLCLAGLLYFVDLALSGYANAFYSAAVESATKSWKAFFFGSFDASNFITVDKPPAALWAMDLSARLFGVSSWSILAPQALEGVASVALLYATVRRRFSPFAALLAGLALALTPVAVLMFRFNNPDALLTLLLIASAYALTRALEHGSTRWIVLAGTLIGFGFLAKMMQAFLVVPGFAGVYLLAAPVTLRRRLAQLIGSGVALLVAGGWWVAVVALWPASSRPYIGGSQDNSILNLIFGYNGFGRLTGAEAGSVVGGRTVGTGGAAGGMWGPTGITRLFGSEMGTQISWLLPAALLMAIALLLSRGRAARTDASRAAVLLWGSWMVVTGLVLSFAQGIVHPYYTVALAPAIAALFGIGVALMWGQRHRLRARLVLATAVAGTAMWGGVLLERTSSWLPWLRPLVLVCGIAAGLAIALCPPAWWRRSLPGLALLAVALATTLAAPAAYALTTASSPHTGSLPAAGPTGAVSQGGPGGAGGFRRGGFAPGGGAPGAFAGGTGHGSITGAPAGRSFSGTPAGAPSRSGGAGAPPGGSGRFGPGAPSGRFGPGGSAGGLGGLLDAGTPSSALVKLLRGDAADYKWVAAVVGANSAAGVQLASGDPTMAIGGFNGTDPTPTLTVFESDVRQGEVHYYLAAGGGGQGGSTSSEAIAAWVEAHYTARPVGGVTVYDLTTAKTSSPGATSS